MLFPTISSDLLTAGYNLSLQCETMINAFRRPHIIMVVREMYSIVVNSQKLCECEENYL